MPTIPVPCTNCFRFHYGVCYERPKQCRDCGGINHMERYCPNKNKMIWKQGEPLPGTFKWCEMWGLNDDLDLKAKVLTAIKTYPGTAIWVNQVCIYQGNNRFFESEPVAPMVSGFLGGYYAHCCDVGLGALTSSAKSSKSHTSCCPDTIH